MAIYRVDYFKTSNSKYVMVEANSKREAINKAIEENHWQKYPVDFLPLTILLLYKTASLKMFLQYGYLSRMSFHQ